MLFGILLTAQVLICAAMGGLILIQRSEGGALGMGGGPSGFMSARGAGNLLTKLTWIFAALLFANSIGMTVVGNLDARGNSVINQLDASKLPAAPLAPASATTASSAAASTSSAPSLNDLPGASTPAAGPQTTPANGLSSLPVTAPSAGATAASPVAPPKMPKPLAVPAHAAAPHLPSNISTSSVSLAPLGARTSHSAAAPNIFPTSSAPATTPPPASSSAPAPAPSTTVPAGTPASSQ